MLLESPSGRLWGGGPGGSLLVLAGHSEPLLGGEGEFAVELVAGVLAVDKVAEAAAHAALARIKAAAGFAKVGDGGELAVDGATRVPAGIQLVACLLGAVFVFETGVDVAD